MHFTNFAARTSCLIVIAVLVASCSGKPEEGNTQEEIIKASNSFEAKKAREAYRNLESKVLRPEPVKSWGDTKAGEDTSSGKCSDVMSGDYKAALESAKHECNSSKTIQDELSNPACKTQLRIQRCLDKKRKGGLEGTKIG